MTNTLHRYGSAESFYDDYVIFAIPSRGKNDAGSLPKLKQFLEMALPFKPVNLGDSRHGGALRSSKSLNPFSHWRRNNKPDFDAVIAGVDTPTTVAAVFDNLEAAEACTKHTPSSRTMSVAEIVGIPGNTVKTRMFYARRKLSELLAAQGVVGASS